MSEVMLNFYKFLYKRNFFIFIISFSLYSTSFAALNEFICTSSDKKLLNQTFSVDTKNKKVQMNDQRKIFDVIFSPLKIEFKKSLSIRNIDSLTSKKKEYFVYKFDKSSLNLKVSLSRDLKKIFSYTCRIKN